MRSPALILVLTLLFTAPPLAGGEANIATSDKAIATREPSVSETADELKPDLLDGTLSGYGDYLADIRPKRGLFRLPTVLDPYFDFKRWLREKTGFGFSGSYGVMWQNVSSSLIDERNAVSSKLTLNFNQELLFRGTPDVLVFELVAERRAPLGTDLTTQEVGQFGGSLLSTAPTWGEFDFGVTQWYLRQNLFNNRVQYAVGKLFAPNFVNPYPFFDDNRQFFSQQFTTSPAIETPLRTFGGVIAVYPIPTSNVYLQFGMYSANSADTDWVIDDFFTSGEHFYHVDIGWTSLARSGTPIQGRGPTDPNNFSITFWQQDEQDNGRSASRGIAFNANFMVSDNFMPFIRGGFSEGWLIKNTLSTGFGYRPPFNEDDLFGMGFGWAEPAEAILPFPELRSQYTFEMFYRFNVTPNFAITPDLQIIFDPSLNPELDVLWVLGLRSRIVF